MKWQTRFINWLVGEYLDSRPVPAVHQDPPPAPAPVVTVPAVVFPEPVKRDVTTESCGTCQCWLYSDEKGFGTCHRNSPWHVNAEMKNRPRGVWLITEKSDWCYEHVRR